MKIKQREVIEIVHNERLNFCKARLEWYEDLGNNVFNRMEITVFFDIDNKLNLREQERAAKQAALSFMQKVTKRAATVYALR